jgi:hypothetical protein
MPAFLKKGNYVLWFHPLAVLPKELGNSISKVQIQGATYVFELIAGNCHR